MIINIDHKTKMKLLKMNDVKKKKYYDDAVVDKMKLPRFGGLLTRYVTIYDYAYLKYDIPEVDERSISFSFSDYIKNNFIILYGYKNKHTGTILYATRDLLDRMSNEQINSIFGPSKLDSLLLTEIASDVILNRINNNVFRFKHLEDTGTISTPIDVFK